MNVPAAATTAGGGGDATSEPGSLLSSQMTGREFGDSMYTTDVEQPTNNPKFPKFPSCSSLSVSTCSERPAALLEKSTGSLTSVTSGSKPPSERSNISLTPPSRVTRSLSNLYGSHLETGRRLTVGLLIVVLIALSWVGSTQTAKSSFAGNHGVFKAPFFVMWFGTGWMMVLYPLSCLLFCVQHWKKCGVAGLRELWSHSARVFSPTGITFFSLMTSTVPFTLIWVATNYMYVRALTVIEASDVTAIFSSAPAFVFILSLIFLREPPLILRFLAVLVAIGGILLFAYENGFKSGAPIHSAIGVALSVGAAIGAAFYKVLLKLRVKEASIYQMSLFLSSLGLFSTLILWPVVLTLHFTKVEELSGNGVVIPWKLISVSAALSVVFNFSINFGIAYTYPLFISLGTVLGIPLNGIVDIAVRHVNLFLTWKFVGVDLVVAAFLLMLLPPHDSRWIQKNVCCCFTGSNCPNCARSPSWSSYRQINSECDKDTGQTDHTQENHQ